MRSRFAHHEKPPLHVLSKTPLGRWPIDLQDVWEIFCETIQEFHEDYKIRTHAFVLMGNHYHWICTHDLEEDPTLFEWFHEVLNFKFLEAAQPTLDAFSTLEWEPKIIKLDPFPYYQATYRYVYANPIKAGLVKQAQLYTYSTLGWVMGDQSPRFQVIDNMHLIIDAARTVDWINSTYTEKSDLLEVIPYWNLRVDLF